jgi:hypothetical protein
MGIKTRFITLAHPEFGHIAEKQEKFQKMIGPYGASAYDIAEFLDGLDHPTRLACTRSLNMFQLKKLYDMVAGFKKITTEDIVTPEVGPGKEVREYGKNSLPVFSFFEKRFMRPTKDSKELYGYNFAPLGPVTGWGYFVAKDAPDRGEVDVDYYSIPPSKPLPEWPEVEPNEKTLLSKAVYAYMVDKCRGVSKNVVIGRAWKQGKIQSAWFILCRE